MKYVFVCKYGEYRSAIAARLVEKIAFENGFNVKTDYFGVRDGLSNEEKRGILADADRVYIMESYMKFDIEKILGFTGEIFCLDIEDNRDLTESGIKKVLQQKIHFI